ncbi:PucR family transcriptional regulator [Aneurinibacillus terranovensis]|uniref:PucR family transcriptional regulator n=1 Tax=Aneurinibacillus terranovensis TaxID=278991 RepID=UPI000411AFF9|nr:PucR family transcriptional regulator [Aneurinibacillus terranovensis]
MGIMVKDMLQLEPVKDFRVLAGQQGLDRKIEKVSVLEIPKEFDRFFEGGEFVLTTFHSLSHDLEGQVETIKKFAQSGVAALGLHPMVTGKIVHEELLKAADRYGLPLILLPPSMTYATVFSTVLGTILNQQSQILQKSEEINREMTRVILHGGDINTIASTLSGLIKQPVLITSDMFEVLAVRSGKDGEEAYLAKYLDIQKIAETIHSRQSTFPVKHPNGEVEYYSTWVEHENQKVKQVVVPAGAANAPFGYIITWELAGSLQELDLIALAHASTAVALEIAKKRAVTEAEKRLRSDFLTEVFEGKYTREEDLYSRGRMVGLHLAKKHMLLAARFEQDHHTVSAAEDPIEISHLENRIHRVLRPKLETHWPNCSLALKGDMVLIFIHFDRLSERDHARYKARELALVVKETLESEFEALKVSIGIGDFYPSPLNLGESYREALRAVGVGCKMFGAGSITAVQDLGVFGILGELSQAMLGEFTTSLLDKLYEYDSKNQTDLVLTVEAFLDEKESFTDVGKRLFIHPNTVKYRIEKVREVLGFDPFKNPEQRLNLHLALKARKLLY